MRSDQGAQLVRADKELRALGAILRDEKVAHNHSDIDWDFNVPSAPHYDGFFERLVQSTKRALATVLTPGVVTGEELHTAACTVESILNRRPLAQNPSFDHNDPDPLTPAHFKVGTARQVLSAIPGSLAFPLTRRWYHVQKLMDRFWARFCLEIIPHYHALNQWVKPQVDLQPGDLVLYLNAKIKGKWPVARVVAVHQSQADNRVRSVIIKCNGSTFERSVHQLLRLEAAVSYTHLTLPTIYSV